MRSGFEKIINQQLKDSKVSYEYETQPLTYTLTALYFPDFILDLGIKKLYIETKGEFSLEDRNKMKAVKNQHPDLDIRLIFMRDNLIGKRSKNLKKDGTKRKQKRYSDWATENGFPWAVGSVPEEWLKDAVSSDKKATRSGSETDSSSVVKRAPKRSSRAKSVKNKNN